jgi:hypothetical protein
MRSVPISVSLVPFIGWIIGAALMGCVPFESTVLSTVEDLNERPAVAILPVGFDLEIRTLSAVKTVHEMPSTEEESKQGAETLRDMQQEARPCVSFCHRRLTQDLMG